MAKIGTAHVEIKPVLSDGALDEIVERIESAVRAAVEAGLNAAREEPTIIHAQPADGVEREHNLSDAGCWCNPEVVKVCGCTWCKRGLDHPVDKESRPI